MVHSGRLRAAAEEVLPFRVAMPADDFGTPSDWAFFPGRPEVSGAVGGQPMELRGGEGAGTEGAPVATDGRDEEEADATAE
jgi:hypothetical protein